MGLGSIGQGIGGGRRFKLFPILLFGIFAVVYYFSNQQEVPITGRKHMVTMSPEQEVQLGLQSYHSLLSQSPVKSSGKDVDLVKSVGQKIALVSDHKDLDWEFNVIDSPEINAFCLPGGKVGVYSGIVPVAQNADGLAVVMGHEIAHAIARHGAERMAHEQLAQFGQPAVGMATNEMDNNQRRAIMGAFGIGAQYGVLLPFSRSHESEADKIGLIFMARACFNPEEAPLFWQRMAKAADRSGNPPEFLSTHPSSESRIAQLREWMPEALAERDKYCTKGSAGVTSSF